MSRHSHNRVDIPNTAEFSKWFQLFEILDDAGFDLLAMLLLLWCILTVFALAAGNLYLKYTRPQSLKASSLPSKTIDDDATLKASTSPFLSLPNHQTSESEKRLSNFKSFDEWIQKVSAWASDFGQSEIAETWILEANERSRKLTNENGLFVEFVPIKLEQFVNLSIDNVRNERQTDNSLVCVCQIVYILFPTLTCSVCS